MICQSCGVEAPTKYVAFYQNIGALVMRFSKSIEGNLCKSCIHKHFWTMTPITLLIGWLGTISVIIAPFLVLNNIFRYLFCLTMSPVPAGAVAPRLTEADARRIEPYAEELFTRLQNNEPLEDVADDIGELARVTPGQVVLYLRAVLQGQQSQQGH
jgi:hypothetical protein